MALKSSWLGLALLLIWGIFVLYSHLGAPVASDEALYAMVSRNLARSQDWFTLEYNGQPFLFKPPLHFWLGALSLKIWGISEWALRFPSATMGLFTIILVYVLGRRLFAHRVGLLAALITSTTYIVLWLARQGKMDVELGFLMNLGFAAFFLAFLKRGRRVHYLLVAFLAMAAAVMLKGPIGILLPGAAGMAYLLITRRTGAWREGLHLLAGLALFLIFVVPYYWRMSPEFNRYFFIVENLNRISEESKPLLFYFYMIFVEFLPWNLFFPSLAIFYWNTGPKLQGEEDRVLAIWLVVFFVFLCIPAYKEEDFLVYLMPAVALSQARLWDCLLNAPPERLRGGLDKLIRLTAMLLASGFAVALLASPTVLRWRFPGFPDFLPLYFTIPALILSVGLLLAAARMNFRSILLGSASLAVLFTIAMVQFLPPAAIQYRTSRNLAREIQVLVGQAPLFLAGFEGSSDLLYYLDRQHPVPLILASEAIPAALRSHPSGFGLVRREMYDRLAGDGFSPMRIAEYRYGKWHYVLIINSP
jgi:4-amino-4-deoxy-L-arabinose transferase-like glycosyltransferase